MDFRFDYNWASANEPIDGLFDKNDPDCKEWITSYLELEKRNIFSLQEALQKNDYYKIAYIADMLYGHGGSIGYPLISRIGKAIILAVESKDNTQISTLISYLSNYIDFLFTQQ